MNSSIGISRCSFIEIRIDGLTVLVGSGTCIGRPVHGGMGCRELGTALVPPASRSALTDPAGRPTTALNWYIVLALFKLAAIVEGAYLDDGALHAM